MGTADLAMLRANLGASDIRAVRLDLVLSKEITQMPGEDDDWAEGKAGDDRSCLVIDTSGCFDVVSYIYTGPVGDLEKVRHFTNGDVPRPETDFVAWALLPDLT